MEKLIAIAIVLILILIFTGRVNILIVGVSILIAATAVFMTFFFVVNFFVFITFRPRDAEYLRIEGRFNDRWHNACYLVDGEEYLCIMPWEGIFIKQLYKKNKKCKVLFNKKIGRVYDKYAIATSALGLVFSIGLDIGLVLLYLSI
ncbi:MAG: hypothetical protein IKS39_10005 [Clostridia bacterium]|nr:hypothetical protein [Clostridia bacterium]